MHLTSSVFSRLAAISTTVFPLLLFSLYFLYPLFNFIAVYVNILAHFEIVCTVLLTTVLFLLTLNFKVKVPSYYRRWRLLRENRGTALLFFVNLGTLEGGGWSTPRPGRLYPGKDPVPIVQESGWASEPVWIGAENLASTGIRSPALPTRSESLYRLRHPGSYS
jgi:hypothetical protein